MPCLSVICSCDEDRAVGSTLHPVKADAIQPSVRIQATASRTFYALLSSSRSRGMQKAPCVVCEIVESFRRARTRNQSFDGPTQQRNRCKKNQSIVPLCG